MFLTLNNIRGYGLIFKLDGDIIVDHLDFTFPILLF